jgi:hypothetical protein
MTHVSLYSFTDGGGGCFGTGHCHGYVKPPDHAEQYVASGPISPPKLILDHHEAQGHSPRTAAVVNFVETTARTGTFAPFKSRPVSLKRKKHFVVWPITKSSFYVRKAQAPSKTAIRIDKMAGKYTRRLEPSRQFLYSAIVIIIQWRLQAQEPNGAEPCPSSTLAWGGRVL